MVHYDIASAYPRAMAAAPYAAGLREVAGPLELYEGDQGIAEAEVIVPDDLPWAPLPEHPVIAEAAAEGVLIWPRGMVVRGRWPLGELRLARGLGSQVHIRRAWVPDRTLEPFGAWARLVTAGRGLPGRAAQLAKRVANLLWGCMAMSGSHSTWGWPDEKAHARLIARRPPPRRPIPQTYLRHIAAETTSRVRSKLLAEGIYGGRYSPVYVDTDGIIIRRSAPCPAGGGWREKWAAPTVEIRAPQVFRRTCPLACGATHPSTRWHYTYSGVEQAAAAERWRLNAGFTDRLAVAGQYLQLTDWSSERLRLSLEARAGHSFIEAPRWRDDMEEEDA
jgi:hypothetical protein